MKANTTSRSCALARSGALASCLLVSVFTVPISAGPDPANPESKPLKDDSAEAGRDSTPVEDSSKAAGNDSRKVADGTSDKASPEARRTTDSSRKAGPDAAAVNDGNKDKANPASRPAAPADRAKQAGEQTVAPEEPTAFENETAVRAAVTEAEAAFRQSKLQIAGPDEARTIIGGLLGADGAVSRAEEARMKASGEAEAAATADVPDEMRTQVSGYLRDRLRGPVAADREVPAFFRDSAGAKGQALVPAEGSERFFHSGRRYVHFHSKTSIPAVVLANAALGRIAVQPVADATRVFATAEADLALLPEAYRAADAWVISYPVSKESMISSGDIVFRPGSTQFSDTRSYDMVVALSEALQDPALENERFVIEAHTSAEGSFEENQILSQERAEAIARALVREGVSLEQVIPVGYGESEARHPANSPEELRSRDRRIVVVRLGGSNDVR
jgi:outer membrane protein OmpA-like peptidoglycan-associated protein